MEQTHVSAGIAFLAGLVSFVSPCVLPLVPAYLSFLSGASVEELSSAAAGNARTQAMIHALAFIAGFTIVFVALGASASALGGALRQNQVLIARIGGIIVIIFGVQMLLGALLGIFPLKFLAMDKRVHVTRQRRSLLASGLVGIAFSAGWSPCIGPILGLILTMASQTHGVRQGAWLLFVYSMGLAVPFFVTAAALGVVLPALNRIKYLARGIEVFAGVFLIATGVVLVTNSFLRIAGWFYGFVPTPKI
jgi:cytochrome c-type biogenesis protein